MSLPIILIIAFVAFLGIYFIYEQAIYYPALRKKLGTALEQEESHWLELIENEKQKVSELMVNTDDPTQRKILQNFIDNHYRKALEVLYNSWLEAFKTRKDFNLPHVRYHFRQTQGKLEELAESHPFKELDLASVYSEQVQNAYGAFAAAATAIKTSQISLKNGKAYFFPVLSFGAVKIGNIEVPAFQDDNGNVLYIYPSFLILQKNVCDIKFLPLEALEIEHKDFEFLDRDDKQPSDAFLTGRSYRYITKTGAPDRRYGYNPSFGIYNFATLYIEPLKSAYVVSNRMSCFNFTISKIQLTTALLDEKSSGIIGKAGPSCETYTSLKINDNDADETPSRKDSMEAFKNEPLRDEVLKFVGFQDFIGTSNLQRQFSIGYNRALGIVDALIGLGFQKKQKI